jgi:Fic family protein
MSDRIFKPHYNITDEISANLEDIEHQSWLENMLIMPKHEAWLQREVRVRRASGTTRIEGSQMDEKAVGDLLRHGVGGEPSEDERANLNANEAYDFVDFLSDQSDIPIDEFAIRELNRLFMKGFGQTITPGVYRKGQNTVGNFTPPNSGDVPSLMRAFGLWLREDEDNVHPVLKAGLAHIHFVAIHPFWDGNGRTGRALMTLILQRSPYGFKKLLPLEESFFNIRDDYMSDIERTLGSTFSAIYDATKWLEHFTFLIKLQVETLVKQLASWHQMMNGLRELGEAEGLRPRQIDGHMLAVQSGQITRSEYVEVTGVSPVTASRDLRDLVQRGLLAPSGNTRSRVYYPVTPQTT